MENDLIKAKQLLSEGIYTCVLCQGERCRTSTARGVRPLVEFLNEGGFQGFSAADKVIGKATAFLYVLLGVRAVYTPVISESALAILQTHGIRVEFDLAVPAILNRSRTGFCPMETAVRDIEDPCAAVAAIEDALDKLLHRQN